MSAKIIDLSARRNGNGNGKGRSHDVAAQASDRSQILKFAPHSTPADEKVAKSRRVTRDLQDELKTVEDRGEALEDYFTWSQQRAWGFVASWYEAFALGIKHADFQLRLNEELFPPEKLQWMKDNPNPKQPDAYQNVMHGISFFKGERYFYERCAQIYAEEMREAERLAAEARERAAKRIAQEFGEVANDVPAALRENDLQGWTGSFDWS